LQFIFQASSESIPEIIILAISIVLIILAYDTGSLVGSYSKITKELVGEYMLCDPSKVTSEINSHFQIFNTVLLSEQIQMIYFRFASISKTFIGIFIFSLIITNLERIIKFIFPLTEKLQ
jgi:hypothetical protein